MADAAGAGPHRRRGRVGIKQCGLCSLCYAVCCTVKLRLAPPRSLKGSPSQSTAAWRYECVAPYYQRLLVKPPVLIVEHHEYNLGGRRVGPQPLPYLVPGDGRRFELGVAVNTRADAWKGYAVELLRGGNLRATLVASR